MKARHVIAATILVAVPVALSAQSPRLFKDSAGVSLLTPSIAPSAESPHLFGHSGPSSLLTPRVSMPIWLATAVPGRQELAGICGGTALRDPLVNATLRADGVVEDVNISRSTGCEAADRLVAEAVGLWTFQPAQSAAKAETVHMNFCVSLAAP